MLVLFQRASTMLRLSGALLAIDVSLAGKQRLLLQNRPLEGLELPAMQRPGAPRFRPFEQFPESTARVLDSGHLSPLSLCHLSAASNPIRQDTKVFLSSAKSVTANAWSHFLNAHVFSVAIRPWHALLGERRKKLLPTLKREIGWKVRRGRVREWPVIKDAHNMKDLHMDGIKGVVTSLLAAFRNARRMEVQAVMNRLHQKPVGQTASVAGLAARLDRLQLDGTGGCEQEEQPSSSSLSSAAPCSSRRSTCAVKEVDVSGAASAAPEADVGSETTPYLRLLRDAIAHVRTVRGTDFGLASEVDRLVAAPFSSGDSDQAAPHAFPVVPEEEQSEGAPDRWRVDVRREVDRGWGVAEGPLAVAAVPQEDQSSAALTDEILGTIWRMLATRDVNAWSSEMATPQPEEYPGTDDTLHTRRDQMVFVRVNLNEMDHNAVFDEQDIVDKVLRKTGAGGGALAPGDEDNSTHLVPDAGASRGPLPTGGSITYVFSLCYDDDRVPQRGVKCNCCADEGENERRYRHKRNHTSQFGFDALRKRRCGRLRLDSVRVVAHSMLGTGADGSGGAPYEDVLQLTQVPRKRRCLAAGTSARSWEEGGDSESGVEQ